MSTRCPAANPGWQAAECLVSGLTQAGAEALWQRVSDELGRVPRPGVSFPGSLLIPQDEVLLCLFRGSEADVRAVSERAGLPFERIVSCTGLGWQPALPEDHP